MKAAAALLALILTLPSAAKAGPAGGLFAFVDETSDYRFQGQSNTDGRPAFQANVHYWRPDGWYAGVFASQVDLGDPGHTRAEADWYGGKNLEFDGGKTELKLQMMDSVFIDNRTIGPTFDFLTGEVALKRTWTSKLTTSTLAAFVPQGSYRSGKIWRVQTDASYALTPAVTLNAQVGDQWAGRNHTRAYWGLGAAYRWKSLGFDLRYVDTDRTRANCPFLPKSCDPAVVATVTAYLPGLMF
jgi:uncharacterized protein (TIGR02001 family)